MRTFLKKRERQKERYKSHSECNNNNSGGHGDTAAWFQESEEGLQTPERGQSCTIVRDEESDKSRKQRPDGSLLQVPVVFEECRPERR